MPVNNSGRLILPSPSVSARICPRRNGSSASTMCQRVACRAGISALPMDNAVPTASASSRFGQEKASVTDPTCASIVSSTSVTIIFATTVPASTPGSTPMKHRETDSLSTSRKMSVRRAHRRIRTRMRLDGYRHDAFDDGCFVKTTRRTRRRGPERERHSEHRDRGRSQPHIEVHPNSAAIDSPARFNQALAWRS
jgi:hypothetical protein